MENIQPNVEEQSTFTQEQVDALRTEWIEKELSPLQEQVNELMQYKPQEKTEQEFALEQRELALWEREVSIVLKDEKLEEFAEFLNVNVNDLEALNAKVAKLKAILGERELKDSFKPDAHKSSDKYSIAEKQKDAVGMIGTKLSKLI